jgi:SAM-dependent methyltransferase
MGPANMVSPESPRRLRVFVCGAGDVTSDLETVSVVSRRVNEAISHTLGCFVEVSHWQFQPSALDAEEQILRRLRSSHLCIFLFYRKWGPLTHLEFKTVLEEFNRNRQLGVKVFFKFVPTEIEDDAGPDYGKVLAFKESLKAVSEHGLLYHEYRNDQRIARPFRDNHALPSLEMLAFQELANFVVTTTGRGPDIVTDRTRILDREAVTRDMMVDHWIQRSKRPGLAAVMSERYPPDRLVDASECLVKFVLDKTAAYLSNVSVLELGCGIGRFTVHLQRMARSIMAVDACGDMIELAKENLGEMAERVHFEQAFVEDLPRPQTLYGCAFSCLLFVHILRDADFKRAVERTRDSAHTLIFCEHMDEAARAKVSNFTLIRGREKYEELLRDSFDKVDEWDYDYLGDRLTLLIFRRRSLDAEMRGRTDTYLARASCAKTWERPAAWERWYDLFRFADRVVVPYEHLVGSSHRDECEFSKDQVAIRRESEWYVLPDEVRDRETELVQQEVERVRKKGEYIPTDEKKARIMGIRVQQVDPISGLPTRLHLDIAGATYFQYVAVKQLLNQTAGDFRERHTAHHLALPFELAKLATTNVGGCGLFLLTQDDYVILSQREMVAEHPQCVSYSASGSMGWNVPGTDDIEADPFLTIIRETYEELGIYVNADQLRLFAIGMDVTGFFVQFSFYGRVPMGAHEVISAWQTARSRHEQDPFALPFRSDSLSDVIVNCPMEPSAQASLIQMACKFFGKTEFERCVARAAERGPRLGGNRGK